MIIENPGQASKQVINALYHVERKAFSGCNSASRYRFQQKFTDDAIIAASRNGNGNFVGFAMAMPFDTRVQRQIKSKKELVEKVKPLASEKDFGVICDELEKNNAYYVNNFAVLETAKENLAMMHEFFGALEKRGAKVVMYFGRMKYNKHLLMEKIFERRGFRKACSYIQQRNYGEYKFTVYIKI